MLFKRVDYSFFASIEPSNINTLVHFKQTAEDLPPSILKGPSLEETGIENRTKTLPCEVLADRSDLQIIWYRDSKTIREGTKGFKYLSNGGLEISDIQRNYEGKYHCSATSKYGTTPSDKGFFKVKCRLFILSGFVCWLNLRMFKEL